MKLLKHILKLLLIITIAFSAIACGEVTDDRENNSAINSTTNEASNTDSNTQTVELSNDANENGTKVESSSEKLEESSEAQQTMDDFDYEEEPDSPVAEITILQAEQGVSDREAARFFKTFSTIPVYYKYETTSIPEDISQFITISIDEIGRTYTLISDEEISVEIVSTADEKYYELDRENKTANQISKEMAQGEIISKDVFEQLYAQAELLYYVGSGKAQFGGRELDFEEYTKDNRTFVRYYFDDKSVFGHRTFEDNQLKSQVKIEALKNYFPEEMDIFLIPEDFTINEVSTSE